MTSINLGGGFGKDRSSRSYRRLLLFMLVCSLAATARAQTLTGTISGVVKDSSGAVLPHVAVTIENEQTNQQRTQETADTGNFTFSLLSPGNYRLQVDARDFKKFIRSNITVEVNQEVVINPTMEVGNTTQTVEVKAETPLLQPATSSLGQVISNRYIEDLPLVGRNTLALVGLTAGVQPMGAFGGIPAETNAYNQGFVSIGGSQVVENATLIDGVNANAAIFNAPAFVPSPADVLEFKVMTNNFSAEFGRTAGGVVNIVTKSGTKQFHGSVYEFFRNHTLDANNWLNNHVGKPKPFSQMNQFGVEAGGPVVIPGAYNGRDKTFWFANYEGLRDRRGLTALFTIPTPRQLRGDFRQTFDSSGQLIRIYDPRSTRPDPSNPGKFLRDPFLNNMILSDRIDSVAAKVAALWPAPNQPGTITGANNFFGSGTVPNTENIFTIRVDHAIGEKNKVFGRFSFANNQRGAFDFFHNGGGWVNPGGGGVPLMFNARNAALDYEWTISPTMLFDFNAGFVRQFVFKNPALTGLDLTTLGFPAALNQQIYFRALPAFQPSGFRAIAPASSDLLHRADNTISGHAAITKVLSRQTIATGVDVMVIPAGELQPGAPQGQFNFNSAFTGANPLSASSTSGSSIASFLLGLPSSGSADFNPAIWISYTYFGGFVQDDIKVNSRLALNAGLRYELETNRNERHNQLSWFDPTVANPLGAQVGIPSLPGGLKFVGVNGNSRRQEVTNTANFGPRFGFAYSLTPRTIVRGGYGLFFLPATGDDTGGSLGGMGFFAATPFVSSLNGGITPANVLSNPFPNGLAQPSGNTQGLATLAGQDLTTVFHHNPSAYTQEWNFDVQRELPANFFFDVAYGGSKGTHLPVDLALNQLPDQDLSLGTALLQQVSNPFAGLFATGPISGGTIPAGQLLRPFPEFNSINLRAVHRGISNYNSLQLKLQRRLNNGFSLLAAYTFSKALTNAGSRLSIGFPNPGVQDSNSLRKEYSPANFDVSHRFVVSYVYELPFGPRKLFFNHMGRFGDRVIGGWQVEGITTVQSGFPLGLSTAANNTNSFGGGSRPNFNPSLCPHGAAFNSSAKSRLNQWFNTACFSQPPAFTFGNTPRELANVRSPGLVDFDFSAVKNTLITERLNLQFRAEFFNFLNNVNFGSPGTTFGTSTFGVISSASDARVVQLALKLAF